MATARRKFALTLLVVSLIALSGCDYPPSHYVCLSCEQGIVADETPESVTVESSNVSIVVKPDGSARWHVRSNLTGQSVETLRESPHRVDRLAESAVVDKIFHDLVARISMHGGKTTDLTARMNGSELFMSFTVEDFATQGFGDVTLVYFFHHETADFHRYELGADQATLTTDADKIVVKPPDTGTVSDNRQSVVWEGKRTLVPRDFYIVYAPSTELADRVDMRLTLASHQAEWLLPEVIAIWFILTVVNVPVLAVLTSRTQDRFPFQTVGEGESVFDRLTDRPPVGLIAVVLGISVSVFGVLLSIPAVVQNVELVLALVPLLPATLFFVLGFATGRYPRVERSAFLALLCLPIPGLVALFLNPSHTGPGINHVAEVLPVTYGILFVTGIPLFFAGYFLQARESSTDEER